MSRRWSAVYPGSLFAVLVFLAAPMPPRALAAPAADVAHADRERLAQALSVPAADLVAVTRASERLADGRVVTTIKAVDTGSDRVVGQSFLEGHAVDLERLRHEANTLWRFAQGAKSAALVERLEDLRLDDSLLVEIWYAVDLPEDGGGPSGSVLPPGAATGDSTAGATAGIPGDDGKAEAQPLPPALAAGIEAAIVAQAAGTPAPPLPAGVDKPDDLALDPQALARNKAEAVAAIARVEDDNQQRIAGLRAALAPAREALQRQLVAAGMRVVYASDTVPAIVVEANRHQVEVAARWAQVAIIDPVGRDAGPSLDVARSAHNAVPLNAVGYDGTGVTVAVVEGARVYSQNPFLPVSQTRDATVAEDNHSMGVAGVIRSSHGTHRGMAPGATLISADGQYNTAGVLETAADWAAARAQVMNHSWGFKEQGNSTFNAFDRRLDHITRYSFRFNVHAAGNHGATNCGQSASTTVFGVESPGRGYNTFTVGGFNDGGTVAWDNDVRYNCSASGWPTGDSAGGAHEKPEIAASAVGITSLARTTSSTSPLSGNWSGTSFASPAIAGIAASLMEADAQLAGSPVATRALMMVGAIHGPAETRAVSATASTFATEVGPWWFQGVGSADFPRSYNVYARAGQRVRFAISWLSNVTLSSGTYSNDRLPADLDLRAYRSDGTYITGSVSYHNGFEIVDFYAPASETYEFRVSLFGTWTGGATPFAAAARLDGYLLPRGSWWTWGGAPRPQGMFYDIRPAEEYAGSTIYWRGVAVRPPAGADYDLELYDASWFLGPQNATDPYNRVRLANSNRGGSAVDYILVDGNHWPSAKREHFRALRWNGSGAHSVNAANFVSVGAHSGGLYGPYTMDANTALFVVDLGVAERSLRRVKLLPGSGAGSADLSMTLHRSSSGNAASWAQPYSQWVANANAAGPGGIENLRYSFDGASSDWLGLAVVNNTPGTAPQFYLRIEPSALFADGFNGD